MLDAEIAAIREKEELKRLEQQVEDMLLSLDYKQLIKELDYNCRYSGVGVGKIEIVQILCNTKQKQKDNPNKKLQKVLNHYAVEHVTCWF